MVHEEWIDVTKGIGILLIVLGHNNFDQSILTVIHTFNIPLFFFISGYLYHYSKYKQKPGYFLSQKFKRLVVPYFVANLIILCTFILLSFFELNSFGVDSSINHLIGIVYGNGAPLNPPTVLTNTLNIPSWFLLSLFCASLILYAIAYSHEKYGLPFSLLLSFLIILLGSEISKYVLLPWGFDIACVSMIFMFSGYLYNYYRMNLLCNSFRRNLYSYICILFLYTAILSAVISINRGVDMNTRAYSNLVLFGIGGISGTQIIIEIAKKISQKENLLTKAFAYLGRNSIIILLYHTFIPILFFDVLNRFVSVKELVYSSPILSSFNMLVLSIIVIIIIRKTPFLDRVYS